MQHVHFFRSEKPPIRFRKCFFSLTCLTSITSVDVSQCSSLLDESFCWAIIWFFFNYILFKDDNKKRSFMSWWWSRQGSVHVSMMLANRGCCSRIILSSAQPHWSGLVFMPVWTSFVTPGKCRDIYSFPVWDQELEIWTLKMLTFGRLLLIVTE